MKKSRKPLSKFKKRKNKAEYEKALNTKYAGAYGKGALKNISL